MALILPKLMEEITSISHKLFQTIEKEETLSNSLMTPE